MVLQTDMFRAEWCDDVLEANWKMNQIKVPVAPKITSTVQLTDTSFAYQAKNAAQRVLSKQQSARWGKMRKRVPWTGIPGQPMLADEEAAQRLEEQDLPVVAQPPPKQRRWIKYASLGLLVWQLQFCSRSRTEHIRG